MLPYAYIPAPPMLASSHPSMTASLGPSFAPPKGPPSSTLKGPTFPTYEDASSVPPKGQQFTSFQAPSGAQYEAPCQQAKVHQFNTVSSRALVSPVFKTVSATREDDPYVGLYCEGPGHASQAHRPGPSHYSQAAPVYSMAQVLARRKDLLDDARDTLRRFEHFSSVVSILFTRF